MDIFNMFYLIGVAPGSGGGSPSLIGSLLPIILMIVIFYFLLIRPQQQKQKEHRRMLSELKKGDKVITSGGVFGVITGVRDNRVTLRISDNVRIHVLKSAISRFQEGGETANLDE